MPIAEITRAETSERARLLYVHSYDVALHLTRGDTVFGSVSVIRFDCREPGAASHADLVAEAVHEVTLNGTALDPARVWADGRIALAGLAAENELRVVADCAYTNSGTGMHRGVDSADGKVYLYAKFEPAYARSVYANFEQPDLKAAFTFHVTAPAHWTVLSNQPAPEPEPAGQDLATWHFSPTPRIPTYITTVVAGDYHVARASHTTPTGQQIPLELACRASVAGHLEADEVFELTRQGLDFFTGLFGTPYPFAKYGHAFVPEFSAGATEDAGCVLVSETFVFRSRVTAATREVRAMVIMHEMAHMWFGDLVTMRWWDDLWLNESFAEFCGYLGCAEATRFRDAWASYSIGRKAGGFAEDQSPSSHPVAADAPTLSAAIANFDGISYAKGAAVLKQLVAQVGRENFFSAITGYLAAHRWGNATLPDLLAAVEAASGRSLAGWAQAWLQTAGPNTVRAEFETGTGGAYTRFALLQEAPERYPTLRPHRIVIGLYDRSGGPLARSRQLAVEITGARTEVRELAGVSQPDLLLLNDGDAGYVIGRFDPRSLATVTSSIGELSDPLARAVCWNTLTDMTQQGELPVPGYVAALAAGLPHEPVISVLQALLMQAERLLMELADPGWVPEGKTRLAAAATELLHGAKPGSDHQLAAAKLLGWTATAAGQLDLVSGLLDGSTTVPGLPVDSGLRWSLLQRLAATGRADDARVDAELAADPTDAGRRRAAACRAAMPDAGHKDAAWQLMTSGELGVESMIAVGLAFQQPEQGGLLAPFAGRYLTFLPQLWASGNSSGHMRLLLGLLLFPYPAASPELLAQLDEALAAAQREPGLARTLAERRDSVQRALRSRQLPTTEGDDAVA
jgi:aminopeptidase N